MTRRLTSWRDGLCWRVVSEIIDGTDPVEAARRFEADFFRLRSGELIDAREQLQEAVRYPWPLEVETDPGRRAAA